MCKHICSGCYSICKHTQIDSLGILSFFCLLLFLFLFTFCFLLSFLFVGFLLASLFCCFLFGLSSSSPASSSSSSASASSASFLLFPLIAESFLDVFLFLLVFIRRLGCVSVWLVFLRVLFVFFPIRSSLCAFLSSICIYVFCVFFLCHFLPFLLSFSGLSCLSCLFLMCSVFFLCFFLLSSSRLIFPIIFRILFLFLYPYARLAYPFEMNTDSQN